MELVEYDILDFKKFDFAKPTDMNSEQLKLTIILVLGFVTLIVVAYFVSKKMDL